MTDTALLDENRHAAELQRQREWRKANRDKVRSYKRAAYKKHRLKIRAKQQESYVKRRDEILEHKRKLYQENRNGCRTRQRAYRAAKRDALKLRQRRDREANKARYAYYSTKKAAKIMGVEFDLTPEWFEQRISAGICEMSGMPFNFAVKRGPDSPSVDRIIAGGAYTQANCRMILWSLNRALNNYGQDYMITVFKRVIAHLGDKPNA